MTLRLKVFSGLLLLALVFRLVISTSIYSGDVNNHLGWGQSNLRSGFSGAYDRIYSGIMQPTYPPLALYAFTTSTGLYDLAYQLSYLNITRFHLFPRRTIWLLQNQNVLPAFNKVMAMISDVGIGFLLYRFIRRYFPSRPRLAFLISAAYLFNPAVWFNSSLWGQIESFPVFFLLLSFWLLLNRRFLACHAAFICALLIKQSSVIFIPVFLILSYRQTGLKATVKGLGLQLLIFYAAFLPFFNNFNPLWPFQVYLNRLQTGSGSNYVTDHAFNIWIWTTHLAKIPDTIHVLGPISASVVGLALFVVAAGVIIFKFFKARFSPAGLFLSTGLMPMLAFVLLTKMHERYFAPALPFLVLAAARYRWIWLIYIAVSLAHLANMYHLWWFPRIPPLVTWLSQWTSIELIAVVFIISTAVIFTRSLLPVHENRP